ncbi:MAG: TolB family protein [Sphingobacteriaceae bacterium]
MFSFYSENTNAQILDGGQNPPGIKWREISTENFQILYPTLLETEAQRMANSLDFMIKKISHTLNKKPRSITIILQNQTIESNGFVQLAPRHSEFFATPAQEFDYQDWLNSLAVHELRHVVQFDKLTGNLRAPLFEELAFAIFGVSLPAWFFEGDAVVTETILTQAGRGRQPSWEMPFRANLLNGRNFNYAKNYLGSYKDRTPGYYPLGYFMLSKLRREHGTYILDTLLNDMAYHPIRPFSLSRASKKFTGLNTTQWHNATLFELKDLWRKQLNETPTLMYPGINLRRDTLPQDYLLPQKISESEIIAIKHSKTNTSSLVSVDALGREKLLLRIGIQQEPNLSYAAGMVVWDEMREDIRYTKRSFNVICSYDIKNRKYRQITRHTRLFSPSLSPDGKKIAAIEVDYSNHMVLVELDAHTGAVIARHSNPDQSILQTPQYHASGKKIVYLRVNQQGKAIEEIDLSTLQTVVRLPYQPQLLARPCYAENDILFKAHYNGIDNIYRLNEKGAITQITSATYGAFYPSYDEPSGDMVFSNYQVNGYDIAKLNKRDFSENPLSAIKNNFIDFTQPLLKQEGESIDFSKIPRQNLPSKPYSHWKHLLNFHSVEPILGTNSFIDDWDLGFKAVSNNLLNTFDLYAGYIYNNGLKRSEYQAGFTYKALYPIINIDYTNRPRRYADNSKEIVWREQETELNITLPFHFNYLSQHTRLGLEFSTSYTSRYDIQTNPSNVTINQFIAFPMHYGFYYSQNSRKSNRDLAPRWGQNYRIDYRHFPFDKNLGGDFLSAQSLLFAPGIFKNHSFSASINFQQAKGEVYKYSNDIPMVSGYDQLPTTALVENTVLLDYKFAFAYPDWNLGPLAYIKRLKAGIFADFENINANKVNLPRTYGFELSADLNILRFYLPNIQAGGKFIFSKENAGQNPIFEFGLSYSY